MNVIEGEEREGKYGVGYMCLCLCRGSNASCVAGDEEEGCMLGSYIGNDVVLESTKLAYVPGSRVIKQVRSG